MKLWKNTGQRRLALLAALAFLAGVTGCSHGRYPVHGKVTYPDGSPVTEGSVIGETTEEPKSMAQGSLDKDGSFSWGTEKPGDGAKPGKYRVIVVTRALGELEISEGKQPAIDPKFSNPSTSGIDFEVKSGKNELPITVTKPEEKKRKA